MELRRIDRKHEAFARALEGMEDVTAVSGRVGQVLLYPQHQPVGLYVVVHGVVRRDGNRLLDAARGAFSVPPYEEIDRPAATSFTVARETRMFFIPRSLALHDAEVRRVLETAGLVPARPTA